MIGRTTHADHRRAIRAGGTVTGLAFGVVAGLDKVAVVSEAIEQRRGHFGIAEHARPFAEGEIRGDDHRGAFNRDG
jgi:hypothetical protein